ncbi:MAG TPA: ABC transporter permease [Candidatus Sulfotelmatobacter sp.]|nr:ABC transporter permease [Candidatus Sulfotelmatobacter sp.]
MVTASTAVPEAALPAERRSRQGHQLRRQINLVRELAFTQFKLKYTGSVLGYVWSLLKPLMIFAIMYVVFARIFKISATTPHFPLQLLLGIIVWSFFAESVSTAISCIVANTGLVKKAFFPRPILVISSSLSACMTFIINLSLVVVIFTALRQTDLGWRSLAILPLMVELYALILGISLLLSAMFVFYRDTGHIWEVGSQVVFYGSAVVFPLTPAFLGNLVKVIALNPMAQIIEDTRHALVSTSVPWTSDILGAAAVVPFLIVVLIVLVGYRAFSQLSPRFAEAL